MSEPKKTEFDGKNPPERAESVLETKAADEARHETAIEGPAQDIHDRVVFSTTFVEDVDLLAKHSLEYQQIIALHGSALRFPKEDYEQIKRNLLNVIDTHWDLYKKRFSIPDRLVRLEFTCASGDYYIGLYQGYLCLYQNRLVRHPLAMPLVWPPADVRDQAN